MATFGDLKQKFVDVGLPDSWRVGTKQRLTGQARKKAAEAFLSLIGPTQRKDIESEIERLHSIKDSSRFRVALLLFLIITYENGMRRAKQDDTFDLFAELIKSAKKITPRAAAPRSQTRR